MMFVMVVIGAAGLALLESFLGDRDGTLLVVSHDRAFLERIADQCVR